MISVSEGTPRAVVAAISIARRKIDKQPKTV
jgi:hypothetical protein